MQLSEILKMLRRTRLFNELSDAELEEIVPTLQPVVRHYPKNAVVVLANTAASQIGIIRSGQIAAARITHDGDSYVAYLYDGGQVIGLDAICSTPRTWPMTYLATEESSVLFLSILPLLAEENRDPAALQRREWLWRSIARNMADWRIREDFWKVITQIRPLRKSIMTFFQIMQDKHSSNTFTLKISRNQMASLLGVDRSTLYRELRKLQRDGLIEIKNKYTITVKNL